MKRIFPLYAVNNSFKSNWKLWGGTIKWVKKNKLEAVVALNNAERIDEIRSTGENIQDVNGLKEGMRVFGFDPDADVTNHIEREFVVPSMRERDW